MIDGKMKLLGSSSVFHHVRLTTQSGGVVAEFTVPKGITPYEVLVFGSRIFVRHHEAIEADDVWPVYRETCPFHVGGAK